MQLCRYYDKDYDFGNIDVSETTQLKTKQELLPSQRLTSNQISHLTPTQQSELLQLLDRFSQCFSDTPGFCDIVEHRIPLKPDFKPRQFKAYKVPELLKPEVRRQLSELLELGFIKPSRSLMASPIVCVLKGKSISDGVRLAIDYRYLNKYTVSFPFPISDVSEVIQKVGNASFISLFDATSGYW